MSNEKYIGAKKKSRSIVQYTKEQTVRRLLEYVDRMPEHKHNKLVLVEGEREKRNKEKIIEAGDDRHVTVFNKYCDQ